MSDKMKGRVVSRGVAGNVRIPYGEIEDFCRRHHIRTLSLFGSVLRGDFSDDSDIDILVEFEDGHVPGLLRLVEMEEELSALFDGRKVDLRTPDDLSRYFREDVIRHREVLYSEA